MDQPSRPGPIARAFVGVNRLFGYGAVIGGIGLLADSLRSIFSNGLAGNSWISPAIGLGTILVGWIYIRAPLSRPKAIATDDADDGAK